MLIISFDAVGDEEFDQLMEYPVFSAFSKQTAVHREVRTLFVSNTYPIHVSIATGLHPRDHGLISNTGSFPEKTPIWNSRESLIRAKTLWQAAAGQGLDIAAVFWPVTAYSKTVRYNIPEVIALPGKNQIITSLKAGSTLLQLKMVLKFRKLLDIKNQPGRDIFAAACMGHILRKHNPGLALMHFTAYDSLCHRYGKGSVELKKAFESLDRNLGILLEAAGETRDIVILSDHSQINVHTTLKPNDMLVEKGLLRVDNDNYIPGTSGCYFECCGGSAFFHAGSLPGEKIDELRRNIEQSEGFRRYLTDEEMQCSGYASASFGFCPQPGFIYVAYDSGHKAEHGYPTDMPGYNVFYMTKGFGLPPGSVTKGGSLLDIAPLVASRMGLVL